MDEAGCASRMRLRQYDWEEREVFGGRGKCNGVECIAEAWVGMRLRRRHQLCCVPLVCMAATLGPLLMQKKGSACYWEVVSTPLASQQPFAAGVECEHRTDVW
jgi:hypothetical protein